MAFTTGVASNYKDLMAQLVTFAAANGWTVLTQSETNFYLRSNGKDGLHEIYVGASAFENASSGWYNWELYGSVYWKSTRLINSQPLSSNETWGTYIYLWNSAIKYWLSADADGIRMGALVGTRYEHLYMGLIDRAGEKAQYPYPLFIGGCGANKEQTYSYSDQSAYWAGWNTCTGRLYLPGGTWGRVNGYVDGSSQREDYDDIILRPDCGIGSVYWNNRSSFMNAPDGSYMLEPFLIKDRMRGACYGVLDGVYRISGYQNSSENIVPVDGVNYVVLQDTYRSGYGDFCALRMS